MFAILAKAGFAQIILIAGFKIKRCHIVKNNTDFTLKNAQCMCKGNLFDLSFSCIVQLIQKPINSINIKA